MLCGSWAGSKTWAWCTAAASASVRAGPGDVGSRVHIEGLGTGTLKYFGAVRFGDPAIGDWCGVVLNEGIGKNSGVVDGTRYETVRGASLDEHRQRASRRARCARVVGEEKLLQPCTGCFRRAAPFWPRRSMGAGCRRRKGAGGGAFVSQ